MLRRSTMHADTIILQNRLAPYRGHDHSTDLSVPTVPSRGSGSGRRGGGGGEWSRPHLLAGPVDSRSGPRGPRAATCLDKWFRTDGGRCPDAGVSGAGGAEGRVALSCGAPIARGGGLAPGPEQRPTTVATPSPPKPRLALCAWFYRKQVLSIQFPSRIFSPNFKMTVL